MSVPCAEARGLYKTVSTCYRELYQAHGGKASALSEIVERVFPTDLEPPSEDPDVTQAKAAFQTVLAEAITANTNTADFQAALAKAVPLLLPMINSSEKRAELLLLLGRLLSDMSEEVEGEMRKGLSWLDANSHELHREVAQKTAPLQERLQGIKSAVASKHGIAASETRHWDKIFFEELHNMHKARADEPSCDSSSMDAMEEAELLLQRLRTSDRLPVCPVTGLPYTPCRATSPTSSTNELQNSCRAVSITACGCCMSVYAAVRAMSSRKCPLCSGALGGGGYRDNACMTRAAQAWAVDMAPPQLAESDLDVYFDAKLRLPPRSVADGTLCRGKMRRSGEALAVLLVPLESAAAWERAAVSHALLVTAAAAAMTPLMCTILGVCWRSNDVLIAFPGEYLVDSAAETEGDEASQDLSRAAGTLVSATQLVTRISVESSSAPPGMGMADALELGLSLAEVQTVACKNGLAAPHPSLQTLTPDNIFFTTDGCSVRVPFLSPLSLPCVPPKTAMRLREAAAKRFPMAHSATRSPSTRYTAPEVVNSTSLDETAALGNTLVLAAPVAAAMHALDVEKASVFTVGAVLQFCITGQAPKSAEELLNMTHLTVTLPMGNTATSSIHEAASMHLHATSDLTLRMATQVTRTTDPNTHMRPNLQELQGMLLEELYALKTPLDVIAEGDTEERTSGSVEPGGPGGSRRSSFVQLSGALKGGDSAAVGQSAESLKSGSESGSQRGSARLKPAWNRTGSKGRHPLPQPQLMQPHVFVPQQVPECQPPPPHAMSSMGSEAPPGTEDQSCRVDTGGVDGGGAGSDTKHGLVEDTSSQVSTAQGSTERSVTTGTGSRHSFTTSTKDVRPAEFKITETKPWENVQAAQPAARSQTPPKPPLAHSRQPSKEGLHGAELDTEQAGVRRSPFDAQGEPPPYGRVVPPAAAQAAAPSPLAAPQVAVAPAASPMTRPGMGSRNSSYGALASPQASFDARSRPDSFASGEDAAAGPAAPAASSPRHMINRSSSGSRKAPKTLQQLIDKINAEGRGAVMDLGGSSYKPAKGGWLSGLPNLSRLSSTPTLSSRASIPMPLPNDDNSDVLVAPEDLVLMQTPVNFSAPGFDARSIFQLQVAQNPTHRSQGAYKQLHVSCDHTTLVNGKLHLPPGGQLVLGPGCQQVCFQDVTVTDGTILCHGKGCSVRFTNCILEGTQIVAVGGAFVSINGQPHQAHPAQLEATSCLRHSSIAVFASGAGTQVSMKDLSIEQCQQAVCCASGALVDMEQVSVSGMNITGCEGVWAHSGGRATVKQCTIERVPNGVAADSQGTHLSISESWIRGNAACGVFVGYGARAEIHLSSLDVHTDSAISQYIGLDVIGHLSHVTIKKSTARGNGGYGVHVSDHAYVVAEHVSTQDNGFGAWLVEGRAQAALESCKSTKENAYCCKQGGSIKTVLCWPDFQ